MKPRAGTFALLAVTASAFAAETKWTAEQQTQVPELSLQIIARTSVALDGLDAKAYCGRLLGRVTEALHAFRTSQDPKFAPQYRIVLEDRSAIRLGNAPKVYKSKGDVWDATRTALVRGRGKGESWAWFWPVRREGTIHVSMEELKGDSSALLTRFEFADPPTFWEATNDGGIFVGSCIKTYKDKEGHPTLGLTMSEAKAKAVKELSSQGPSDRIPAQIVKHLLRIRLAGLSGPPTNLIANVSIHNPTPWLIRGLKGWLYFKRWTQPGYTQVRIDEDVVLEPGASRLLRVEATVYARSLDPTEYDSLHVTSVAAGE